MKYVILTTLFLISFVLPVMAEGPFRDIDFEKACLIAKEEKKVVLIDFFTTWCGPCKRLDAVTWKDKDVIEWLEKNTIALKIDAEKEVKLAKEYNISAYPTIALIKPDKTQIDQLIGYKEPKAFLENVKDSLIGKTALVKAEEAFAKNNNSPIARSIYARELVKVGRHEEALKHYLWCFDNGLQYDKSYVGVRLSFLLLEVSSLGNRYKPALDALVERGNKAEKNFLAEPNDVNLDEVVAINQYLGEQGKEKNLALYNFLKERKLKALEEKIVDDLLKELLEAKRYKDILESAGDVFQRFEISVSFFKSVLAEYKDMGKELEEKVINSTKDGTIDYGNQYFTAFLGAKDFNKAKKLAQEIIKFDSREETFSLLIKKAEEFDAKDLAKELSEQSKKIKIEGKKEN